MRSKVSFVPRVARDRDQRHLDVDHLVDDARRQVDGVGREVERGHVVLAAQLQGARQVRREQRLGARGQDHVVGAREDVRRDLLQELLAHGPGVRLELAGARSGT